MTHADRLIPTPKRLLLLQENEKTFEPRTRKMARLDPIDFQNKMNDRIMAANINHLKNYQGEIKLTDLLQPEKIID